MGWTSLMGQALLIRRTAVSRRRSGRAGVIKWILEQLQRQVESKEYSLLPESRAQPHQQQTS